MPLNLFLAALTNVDNEYFNASERVFCYEFYHQFKIVLNNNNIIQNNHNITLDAELPKRRLSPEQAAALGLIPLDNLMSPDIILHERDTGNQQLLVAEIKAKKYISSNELFHDINKLIALKYNYAFHYAVFLAINVNMNRIRRKIQENLGTLTGNNNQRDIYIITKHDGNSNYQIETLMQMINNP